MKALASDFDGTLYFGYSGSVGEGFKEKDLEAIQQFQREGNLFGVCTGRPFRGILYPSKQAMENNHIKYDFYIVSTGALILDSNQNIIYKSVIDKNIAKEIVDAYKDKMQVYTHVGVEDIYTYNQKGNFPIPQNIVKEVEEIEGDIIGVSIEGREVERAQKIYAELQEKYGDKLNIFINASDIDMVNKGVSKGNSCKILKEKLKIDTLYGIGDNYNDIPMLESTDESFAFTYSPAEVEQKATYVVETLGEAIVNLK